MTAIREYQKDEILYIIVPAYNEQMNVQRLINDWYPVIESSNDLADESRLVVIDDGSTDKTLSVLQSMAADRPRLVVLTKDNGGHGDTLLYGYHYAIEQKADWIFQTDSDGQTKADEFVDFWNNRKEFAAILGYRKKRGDGIGRLFVERTLCHLIWLYFRIIVPDANCPFRLMQAEKVGTYINQLPDHYNLPNVMLTVFFCRNKDRVLFRKITFENRKAGKNSINIKKIIRIGLQALKDFSVFKKDMSQ